MEVIPPRIVHFLTSAHVVACKIRFTIYGNYVLIRYFDTWPKSELENQNLIQTVWNAEKEKSPKNKYFRYISVTIEENWKWSAGTLNYDPTLHFLEFRLVHTLFVVVE